MTSLKRINALIKRTKTYSDIPSDKIGETLQNHAETMKLTDMIPELRMNL